MPVPFTVPVPTQLTKPICPEVQARILALHQKGLLPGQIGRATGLSRRQVTRVLAAEGIRRQPHASADTVLSKILELREQGLTIQEIGTKVGFSKGTVGRVLRRQKTA